jgi:hypothetical protein
MLPLVQLAKLISTLSRDQSYSGGWFTYEKESLISPRFIACSLGIATAVSFPVYFAMKGR